MVANLNHVGATGRNIEAYRCAKVLLGGEIFPLDLFSRCKITKKIQTMQNYLPTSLKSRIFAA